jgi:hypothetical protein
LPPAFDGGAFGGGALAAIFPDGFAGALDFAGGAAFLGGDAFFSGFTARGFGLEAFRACFFAIGFFVIWGGSSGGFPVGRGDL